MSKDEILKRRSLEEAITLSRIQTKPLPGNRSDAVSASTRGLLSTGALPGSARKVADERKKSRERRMAAYMALDEKTIAETKGYRCRTAYRLITHMGWITGDIAGPMLLSTLFLSEYRPDPSSVPFTVRRNPPSMPGMQYVRECLLAMNEVDDLYTLKADEPPIPSGMTFLPPPIPDSAYEGIDPLAIPYMRRAGQFPENYNPATDHLLGIWLDAYAFLADALQIEEGPVDEPEAGVWGTAGLFTAESARFMWPTRDELLLFETELMLYVFDLLVEESTAKVEAKIVHDFGYTRAEAIVLVKTAMRFGEGAFGDDIEPNKVRELRALEMLADRAVAGEDPRAAIAAKKQMHLVSGFTKSDRSETLEQFRDLAQKALGGPDEDDDHLLD